MLKVKLTDRCGHSVLSVKAVMVTTYSVVASRPDSVSRVPISPTADVSLNHSTRYMKDHLSGVDGRSHNRSTLGGTGLTTVMFSGGPGQSIVEQYKDCTHTVINALYLLHNKAKSPLNVCIQVHSL